MSLNRRQLLRKGAVTACATALPSWLRAQQAASFPITLAVDAAAAGIDVPANFTGLSYEKAQMAHPGYFSAKNRELVGLVKRLGARGVLRIGGNTSDFASWSEAVTPLAEEDYGAPVGPDAGLNIDKTTCVTPHAIDELRTFLDATGWDVIYGLDLGHGTPEQAAAEAAYAVQHLGKALIALQIGNEPDLYFRNGMRSATYTYSDYIVEWRKFAEAVLGRTPNAPLAGPDVGNHLDWVDGFAKDVPHAVLLTSHFYAEGPPSDPKANIDRLLRRHEKNEINMKRMVALGKQSGVPYRMAECNSCYHGGKEGVSDSFAAALWGADYMLSLAQWGVTGVNFHGGGQGFYTPIAGGGSKPLTARPLFYGMLLYQQFMVGKLLPVTNSDGSGNVRAYASLSPSRHLQLALFNMDQNSAAQVKIALPGQRGSLKSWALAAPLLTSTSGITFGGSAVSAGGQWQAASPGKTTVVDHSILLALPPASGLLLQAQEALHA